VVREALRRLEQMNLVRVAQGGSTLVLDYRKHAGLDLLSLLGARARSAPETIRFWLAVLELRVAIGAEMARLCARRADRKLQNELRAISREMLAAESDESLYELEVRFWDRVAEGADNIVGRLALNSMLNASRAIGDAAQKWSATEARRDEFRSAIAEAIANRDADAAEKLTRQSLRAMVERFEGALTAPPTAAGAASRRKRKPG
jgi:DNA-binding FadR family transcriptional regulator